jgi:hypothetical protein
MLRFSAPLTLAAAVFFTACDTPTAVYTPEADAPEQVESIPGILEAPRWLRSGTSLIPLVGWQTALLEELVGAELLIDGYFDPSDGALIIRDFQVLAVEGLPAFDGTLVAGNPGFLIRTRQRDLWLETLPQGLDEHLGKRVWLTTMAGVPVRYGLLE